MSAFTHSFMVMKALGTGLVAIEDRPLAESMIRPMPWGMWDWVWMIELTLLALILVAFAARIIQDVTFSKEAAPELVEQPTPRTIFK